MEYLLAGLIGCVVGLIIMVAVHLIAWVVECISVRVARFWLHWYEEYNYTRRDR